MPPIFLITRRIPQPGIERLSQAGRVLINPHDRPLTPEELVLLGRDADGWVTMLTDRVAADILAPCARLRGIANYAVGFDHIDLAACTRKHVGVSNTPDVLTDATAEIAWALLLACARRVVEADAFLRSGRWRGWQPLEFLGTLVTGKTLGILGAGRIGMRVARIAQGFNMRILYTARHAKALWEKDLGARAVSLDELLCESDFISLHLPLTEETRQIIGAAELRRMKPTAVLINTARGPLLDETALVAALREKRLGAAGLDVYEREPQVAAGLAQLDNVVLLPHLGSATRETRTRMALLAAENLIAMVQGRRPPNPLNPQLWPE